MQLSRLRAQWVAGGGGLEQSISITPHPSHCPTQPRKNIVDRAENS